MLHSLEIPGGHLLRHRITKNAECFEHLGGDADLVIPPVHIPLRGRIESLLKRLETVEYRLEQVRISAQIAAEVIGGTSIGCCKVLEPGRLGGALVGVLIRLGLPG